jgi:hypothetical protein
LDFELLILKAGGARTFCPLGEVDILSIIGFGSIDSMSI